MAKAPSGELSCTGTGLVDLPVTNRKQDIGFLVKLYDDEQIGETQLSTEFLYF